MGIKEFEHLKKSLSNIESNTKKSQKLENAIRGSGSKIESLTSQIEKIRPQLESAEQIAQRKEEISKLEARREMQEASVEVADSEVKKKGAMEGFPNMMFKSAAKKIKKELKEKRKRRGGRTQTVMFLVLLFVIPTVYLSIYDYYLPWTCDNGEVIEHTSLVDGVNDCSDGSDEEEYFWTSSRAEEGHSFFVLGMGILAIVFLVVGFMLVGLARGDDDISGDLQLYPGYAEAEKKNDKLQDSLKWEKAELAATRRLIAPKSKGLTHIGKKLPAKLDSLENDLEKEEKKKSELESEAASVAEKTDALWEGIRHLLPHSNLLKSD
jgi:septal ring factor EnvC (AmiA/AmiB activator)